MGEVKVESGKGVRDYSVFCFILFRGGKAAAISD